MNQVFQTKSLKAEENLITAPITSAQGRLILDRIRSAMSNAKLENIHPNRIRRMESQPRKTFNQVRLEMLGDSIRESGQMMPGIVRRIRLDPEGRDFELCDGERRWRAVQLKNVPTYRALIIEIDNEAAQYVVSIIANFNREGHTLLELLDSIIKMHDVLKLTLNEIAQNVSLSPGYTTNLYGLRRLHPEVRDMLDPNLHKHTLSTSVAVEIAPLPANVQLLLAKRVISGEVKPRFIRREVVALSSRLGIPVRKYSQTPSKRRSSIDTRIETLGNAVAELEKILVEPRTLNSVLEWPLSKIEGLKASLERSATNLLNCHEYLKGAVEKKKKVIEGT